MFDYIFEEVLEGDDQTTISFENMKEADKTFNLKLFCSAVDGYFSANPTKNFQDLESELRKHNFNTHIIAKSINNINLKYEAIISCKPKDLAIDELLSYWKSYDENFEVLKYVTTITTEKSYLIDDKSIVHFIESFDQFQLISINKLKATVMVLSPEQSIKHIANTYKSKTGKESNLVLFGNHYDGRSIMCRNNFAYVI